MSVKSNRCGFPSFPGRFLSMLKTGNSCCKHDTTFAFSLQNMASPASLSSPALGAYRRKKGLFFFFLEKVTSHQTLIDESSTFSFYPRCVIISCGLNPNSKLLYREQQPFLRHTLNLCLQSLLIREYDISLSSQIGMKSHNL